MAAYELFPKNNYIKYLLAVAFQTLTKYLLLNLTIDTYMQHQLDLFQDNCLIKMC